MKLLFPILFMAMAVTAISQTEKHTLTSNDSAKLAIDFLIGSWSNDSLKGKIQFVIQNKEVSLLTVDAYTYHFWKVDSFPLSGVSMTWPPHDCIVRKLDKNNIEVQYTLFESKPVVFRYKRMGP